MSDIQFWYPVAAEKNPGNNERKIQRKQGFIWLFNVKTEPYEVNIDADGYTFHVIFGRHSKGHFLCIPDRNVGCEILSYKDRYWNIGAIYDTGQLRYEGACAIGNALQLIELLLGKDVKSGE